MLPASHDAAVQTLEVFISYSRVDHGFADQLNTALMVAGFRPTLDRKDVHGAENWKERLGALIRDADTVVFVLSAASARSEVCAWEVEQALKLGKRIIPVLSSALGTLAPPPQISDLHYIHFYPDPAFPGSGFGNGLLQLKEALEVDHDWLHEQTRLTQRATEWDSDGRPNSRLLMGGTIAAARTWAARRPRRAPELTQLQLDFIRESELADIRRQNEERLQLQAIAAAQVARARAMADREAAQKREMEQTLRAAEIEMRAAEAARRSRERMRRALVAMSAIAVVAAVAFVFALYQGEKARQTAERNEKLVAFTLASTGELVGTAVTWASERGVPLREAVRTIENASALLSRVQQAGDASPGVVQSVVSVRMALARSYRDLGKYPEQRRWAREAHDLIADVAAQSPTRRNCAGRASKPSNSMHRPSARRETTRPPSKPSMPASVWKRTTAAPPSRTTSSC